MPQQELSQEERIISLDQVKKFVMKHGADDHYTGKCTVFVNQYGVDTTYHKITVSISFDGLDYKVAFVWDDDETHPDYRNLGLYGVYSSYYNMFKYNENTYTLNLKNNGKSITIQAL